MKKSFRDRLKNETILFDGGVGTYLYKKGIFINTCFDELNLSNPQLVQSVHEEYVEAGADVIESNTFGANRIKLASFGLEGNVYDINRKGLDLAQKASGGNVLVAGSVGPLGIQIEPLGKMSYEEAQELFREQLQPLLDGGADLIVFETFSFVMELVQGIKAARSLSPKIPIVAQVRLDDVNHLVGGGSLENFVKEISKHEVDVLGLNCSLGPLNMLRALEKLKKLTEKPISVQPNAGRPQRVSHRSIYMASPEYMAEYAKRFIQTGASIVGGCCGTHPAHIRAMRAAIQALEPTKRPEIVVSEEKIQTPEHVTPYAQIEKSRLATKLEKKQFVTMVELVSPKGIAPTKQIEKARKLYHFGVDAINIPDGPRASARMSALSLSVIMQREVGVETVLHFACRDRNVIGMQSDLLGAWALGIRNILAITGDPPKLGTYPNAKAVFDFDSIGLVNLLWRLNHGLDLAGNEIGEPAGFSVAVGVNPGAINLDEELRRLDWKIDAGAEYMVTQPIFDLKIFERFLSRIQHVKIPLVCGLWPLISYRNAEFMNNEVPGASVPQELLDRMKKATSKEAAFAEGIKIAKETFRHVRSEVSGIQLSAPLGRVEGVFEILEG